MKQMWETFFLRVEWVYFERDSGIKNIFTSNIFDSELFVCIDQWAGIEQSV
jgi:hypothetical protein